VSTTVPRNCTDAELRRRHAFGGCDRQSISRVENGAYSPSMDRLWTLADALQCPLSELLTATEGRP